MSLRLITLEPLRTALQVRTAFGLQSTILCARDSAENPANTTCPLGDQLFSVLLTSNNKTSYQIPITECTAPIRAQANIEIGNSINMGR